MVPMRGESENKLHIYIYICANIKHVGVCTHVRGTNLEGQDATLALVLAYMCAYAHVSIYILNPLMFFNWG